MTNCTFRGKKVEGHDPKIFRPHFSSGPVPPHFEIRSGATDHMNSMRPDCRHLLTYVDVTVCGTELYTDRVIAFGYSMRSSKYGGGSKFRFSALKIETDFRSVCTVCIRSSSLLFILSDQGSFFSQLESQNTRT